MKRAFKWAGMGVGGILLLMLVVLGGALGFTRVHLQRTYEIDPPPLHAVAGVPGDELAVRGARLLRIRGCVDCHDHDLGGRPVVDDPAVGRVWASNLTRGEGGVADSYTQKDWVRAIRHGVGPDGKPLVFMPSHEFYPIGDEDLGAMIAAIEAAAPVDRVIPAFRQGPVSSVLFMLGRMPLLPAEIIDHQAPRPAVPAPGATIEYGRYLAVGCIGCHGESYSGGKIPGGPPGMATPANITPDVETGIGAWTHEDFVRVLREGIRPDGRQVDAFMPVALTRELTDTEIEAIWLYLRTLEPKEFGGR